jgi:hypothetical protein
MTTDLIEKQKVNLIDIGTMPQSAEEIFHFVRDTLVARAEPLKLESIGIRDDINTLPPQWEDWTAMDCERASTLYDADAAHLKKVESEFKDITSKAFKLHRGITAAAADVLITLPAEKERLMAAIRKWRNREDERARIEAARLAALATKAEEDARIAEATRLEEEALKLAAANPQAAREIQAEAEALVSEPAPFIPEPVVKAFIPKGGPPKRKFMKFKVTDFAILPDMYKVENTSMIQGIANAMKLKTDIPGVKVWEE